jgi:acyl carrier protein
VPRPFATSDARSRRRSSCGKSGNEACFAIRPDLNFLAGDPKRLIKSINVTAIFGKTRNSVRKVNSDDTLNNIESNRKVPERCLRRAINRRELSPMKNKIRDVIANTMKLPVGIDSVTDRTDLHDAGMTSFDAVQLMLALEDAFNVEFPERMLNRKLFSSIGNIEAALRELLGQEEKV